MTIVPFEDYCHPNQDADDANAINFHIIPTAMKDDQPTVNMPRPFTARKVTYAAQPYYGMRAWDENQVPEFPEDWDTLDVFMGSHAGHVVLWQTHIPYKFISGEDRQFHSLAHRYWETTIETMPDTWAVKYDERDGKIYFTIVGKSNLCREDFERAEKAAGGPPQFPYYPKDDEFSDSPTFSPGTSSFNRPKPKPNNGGGNNSEEQFLKSGAYVSSTTTTTLLQLVVMMAVAWMQIL